MGPGLRVHQISRPHCGASHPCHCAWLAWAHSLLRRGKEPLPQHSLHPIRSARALPASSLTQPSWRTAHKLKNISFQQTSLLRIQALSFSSRGELFISLPKKKKKPKTLNHKLKSRWNRFRIWLKFVSELIRDSQLFLGNTAVNWQQDRGLHYLPIK